MTSVLRLGLRLAWGTREQRLRSVAVAVASALGTGFLLLIWAVARDRVVGAGAFSTEAGMIVLGTVLVVALPVVAMVATVARLQTRGREERLANLRRLGLSAARTRLVAAVEVGVASATGVLLGIPLHLALAGLVQRTEVAGQPWNPYLFSVPTYGWVGVLLGIPAVAILVAAWPPIEQDGRGIDIDRADDARPGLWRLVPLLLGLAVCGWALLRDFGEGISDPEAYGVLAGVALAGFGLLLAAPVLVRLVADVGVKVARGPVTTIATRRLQARPGAVLRVVATLMAVLVVLGGTPGILAGFQDVGQYEEAERLANEAQTAQIRVSGVEVPGMVARLNQIPAVVRVVDVPVAEVTLEKQDPVDETLLAAIATCADLEMDAEGAGCVEERVLKGDVRTDLVAAARGTLVPLDDSDVARVDKADLGVELDLSDALTIPAGDLGGRGWQAGAHLLIPPQTPGIGEVVAATNHYLVVYGNSGRDLPMALDEAGIWNYSSSGTEDYDFVEGLLTLMRVVAAMLLALGLLTVTVALVDRAAARRQENASLLALGTSAGVLRGAQFVEGVVPVLLGTVSAVLVGWLGANAWLSMAGSDPVSVPWPLLAGSVVTSFVVAGVTAAAVGSRATQDVRRA